MRNVALLLAVCGLLFASGCAGGPSPVNGFLYSDYSYPGYYAGASDNGPGSKEGSATANSILGWVATGDASIKAACNDGRISKIHTVDHHLKNILGIWAEWTTKVTGE
ncbi:MAG: TRL-like family protein [Planctomycetota bacterium]